MKNGVSFRHWSLRWKSILILLSLILIPALTISLLVYYQSNSILEKQVIERNEQNLRHIESSLLGVMEEVEELSSYIIYSQEFRQYFTLPVEGAGSHPEEMQRLRDHIRGFFTFHLNNKPYFHSAQIEGVNGSQLHLGERISGDETKWEEAARGELGRVVWTDPYVLTRSGWETGEYTIVSLFRIINNLYDITEPIGNVRIRLDERELFSHITSGYLHPNDDMILMQEEGLVLSHRNADLVGNRFTNQDVVQNVQDGATLFQYEEDGDVYYAVVRYVTGTDLSLISTVKEEFILNEFQGMRQTMHMIMLVAGGIGLVAIVGFMLTIIKPITELTKETKRLEEGDFAARVKVRSRDEIGQLGSRFNNAVSQIQRLIETKYKLEIQNKESELNALQSQMNPHFLYNTLDMIRWTARLENAFETGKSIEHLSKLFRISLSQGKLCIPLKDELAYVQSYLDLQKRRLGNQLTFSVLMEAGIEQSLTLKLILQPLVENSLRHGFTELKQTNTITIRAYREGAYVVIDVLDNGVGFHMDVDTFNHVVQDPDRRERGFALRNTHQRLIKTFGFTCGLMAMETDEGAHIRIRMPFIESEAEKKRFVHEEGVNYEHTDANCR
ncbi:sensor histidine kinase [Shouchella lehensis]|uniref:Sensor histidine kinase n=1 Tax=Shouchella lehensis G1 TaxID=1246626 RepID=A0A060M7P5_9BACI|nr:sensor histidine kinase [Shouchella lehensis]AIC96074.1 Sensor histidine kinase [Shouchella lehensis G1]